MHLLPQEDFHKARPALREVQINNFFARSVVEGNVSGKVYVDDVDNPKTFYVAHPYGMSLLFGEHTNDHFNREFLQYALNTARQRDKFEWMQAFPSAWDEMLRLLFGKKLVPLAENTSQVPGTVELNTRVNFRFDRKRFAGGRKPVMDSAIRIKRTDKEAFTDMPGSVVPAFFWDSATHFLEKGVGYSLYYNGELASTAYASFIHDDKLELGIETVERFRGKGLAYHACAALIDHCLETGFEPVWACRLANTGSYVLAQKLGFVPVAEIPYYRLCN